MSIWHVLALATCVVACATDLRTRRIPNALTFGSASTALLAHALVNGASGVVTSLQGMGLGLALFLPFFVLRGMGGGDVKLLAAIGAWVGPVLVLWTALLAGIAGGALALGVALRFGVLTRVLSNLRLITTHWRVTGFTPIEGMTLDTAQGPKLAYAIPVCVGLLGALWLKG